MAAPAVMAVSAMVVMTMMPATMAAPAAIPLRMRTRPTVGSGAPALPGSLLRRICAGATRAGPRGGSRGAAGCGRGLRQCSASQAGQRQGRDQSEYFL
jgi:hypothetical protein